MLRSLFDAYLRHRFACLLGLLVAAVGVDPVLEVMGVRWHALESMLAFSLLAALIGVWHSGVSRLVVLGSIVPCSSG